MSPRDKPEAPDPWLQAARSLGACHPATLPTPSEVPHPPLAHILSCSLVSHHHPGARSSPRIPMGPALSITHGYMYGVACHASPLTINHSGSISSRHHPPVTSSRLLVAHSGTHRCHFLKFNLSGVLVAAHGLFLAAGNGSYAPVAKHQLKEGKEAQWLSAV